MANLEQTKVVCMTGKKPPHNKIRLKRSIKMDEMNWQDEMEIFDTFDYTYLAPGWRWVDIPNNEEG